MATIVYRYGVRTRTETGRYDLPAEVWQQIHLSHRLRNALVEVEHRHDEAMRDLWSAHPQVAEVEQRLAAAEQMVAELIDQARLEHSQDRTTATRRGTATNLREARRAVRDARAARRAAIGEAYPVVKPGIEAVRAARKAAIKDLYREYCQDGDLYWATYNAVVADHRIAVQAVERKRRQGQAAQLRYQRWDGTGTISVQLQRQAGQPARSPELLASGDGQWRNVLQVRPWMPPEQFDGLTRGERKRHGRGEAVWSVGGGRTVTLPIQVHRMMPADADVCEAQLVVTRTGAHWSAALCVTVRLPDPDPVEGRSPLALHCGWRHRPDGSVRVGTWASPEPLVPPANLADVLAAHDSGRWGEIVIPASWLELAGRPAALRSRRDLALEPVQRKLAEWLDQNPQPDGDDGRPGLTGGDVRRWRSANRFAALAIRWRDTPPPGEGAAEMTAVLEAWRRQDKHLWEWEAHSRARLRGRRDDAWRKVGAWLAEQAGVLVVDDVDLAALRQRGDVADDDPVLPGTAAGQARARAALAAPGRLRQCATGAADRRGVAVRTVESGYLTRTCPHCGERGDAHPRYAQSAVVTCPSCGRSYDQDRSAATLMLDRERSGDGPGKGERSQQ